MSSPQPISAVQKGARGVTENQSVERDMLSCPTADPPEEVAEHISDSVLALYDVYSYRHAAAILGSSFPEELREIERALLEFRITTRDIAMPGGNESVIPKQFSSILRTLDWHETQIKGDLTVHVIKNEAIGTNRGSVREREIDDDANLVLPNYVDAHRIDYVKGRVALDLEWNSKDQTYDRDLYAFRMFHECGLISVGVLITRSEKLNPVFERIPSRDKEGNIERMPDGKPRSCKRKYGASTTWMGKLIYRLEARRHGGCPVLVFGIRPEVITDLDRRESGNESI